MAGEDESYCLVLSGGGAKGVYHIGAWKALKELGIQVDAFIGNSIGAIVAGFLAQGEDERLEAIGREIGLDYILAVPKELVKEGEFRLEWGSLEAFRKFYKKILSRKALDTSPLRRHLESSLSEEKIRKTGKDLGIVTIGASDFKAVEIYLEDMGKGELIDYILASSAFPGFEQPTIQGKRYLDGGFHDNIPYAMAKKRGYRNIIVIDISGIGVKRRMDIEGCRTVYIKNSINMGGVLDFNRDFLDRYRELGYLDTLRVFGSLRGYHYFFKPKPRMESLWKKKLTDFFSRWQAPDYLAEALGPNKLSPSLLCQRLFPDYARYEKNWLPLFLDCAAYCLDLERIWAWDYAEILSRIKKQRAEIEAEFDGKRGALIKDIEELLQREIKQGRLGRQAYAQFLLVNRGLRGKARRILLKLLSELVPELQAALAFLEFLDVEKS